jgi:hypothetical protein
MKGYLWIATGLTGLLLGLPAHAQDRRDGRDRYEPARREARDRRDDRRLWVYGLHGENSFRQMRDGTWVESTRTGPNYFTETARTPTHIDLYDASRQAYARLYDHRMLHHGEGETIWQFSYVGHWAR